MKRKSVKYHITASFAGAMLAMSSSVGSAADLNAAYVTGTIDGMVSQIGVDEKIFEKHGLSVSLIAVKTGSEMVSAVASGAAQFSGPAPLITLPAIEKGGDIKFLMRNYDLDYSLLAKPNLGIDTAAAYPGIVKPLKGLRIGVTGRGGLTELFIRKIFTDAGLDPDKDMSIISVGAGATAMAAFQNDQIDALVTLPPVDVIMPPDQFVTVVSNAVARQSVFGPDFIATALVTNGEMISSSPDVVKNICAAWIDTIKFIHDPANKEKVAGHFAKSLNLTQDQAAAVFERYGANFSTVLTKAQWDNLRASRPSAPDWETGVYAPCAEMGSK